MTPEDKEYFEKQFQDQFKALTEYVDERLSSTVQTLKEYVDERLSHTVKTLKEYTDERSRDIETTLLREFRKWALRLEGRLVVQKAVTDNVEGRLAIVEERLDALELKK